MVRSRVKVAWLLAVLLGCSGSTEDESLVAGNGGEAGEGGAGNGGASDGGSSGAPTVGGNSSGGTFPIPEGGSGGGGTEYEEQNLVELRIEPAEALLAVSIGQAEELDYRAFGRFASNPDEEVEITERTVFYVP